MEKVLLSAHVDPDLAERVRDRARAEDRTVASVIRVALKDMLAADDAAREPGA